MPEAISLMEQLFSLPTEQRELLSVCYSYPYSREHPAPTLAAAPSGASTVFCTLELDSFEAARVLVEAGWSPAVLNMANEWNCGGGWCDVSGSQEEDLFRASSLALSLWPRRRPEDRRFPEIKDRLPRADPLYPWSEAQALFSPNVLVCRSRGRPLLQERQFTVAVVSSAAQDLREYKPHYAGPFDRELTWQKLRSLLWVCAHHGHKAVVLGAYGCGAFQHDPDQVAPLMRELLDTEFAGVFDVVVCGIIKSADNLRSFRRSFPDPVQRLPRAAERPCGSAAKAAGAAAPREAAPATAWDDSDWPPLG